MTLQLPIPALIAGTCPGCGAMLPADCTACCPSCLAEFGTCTADGEPVRPDGAIPLSQMSAPVQKSSPSCVV